MLRRKILNTVSCDSSLKDSSDPRVEKWWYNFIGIAWLGTIVCLVIYGMMAMSPCLEVIRAEGVFHEGVVVRKSHLPSPELKNPHAKPFITLSLEDGREVADLIDWALMEKLQVGQKVKTWEYKGHFFVDEHGRTTCQDSTFFLVGSMLFLFLALFIHWHKRRSCLL